MKKALYLATILAAFVLSACNEDLLDNPKLGNSGDTSTFYQGDEAAEAALVTCYYYIKQPSRKEVNNFFVNMHSVYGYLGGDYTTGKLTVSAGQLDTYNVDENTGALNTVWTVFWKVITACNRVTDNFSEGLTPVQKRCCAEANVIKAWAYMNLVQLWGCPPLLTRIPSTNEELKPKNSTPEAVWAYIKECLESAIASDALPQKKNADDRVVRVTKETALTLLGKAQVSTGEYEAAKNTLKQVVTSPLYRLLTTEELRTKLCNGRAGKLNSESLFEIYNDKDNGDRYQAVFYDYYSPCWMFNPDVTGHATGGSYIAKVKAGWCNYFPPKQLIIDWLANEGFSERFKATFVSYEDLLDWGLHNLEKWDDSDASWQNRTPAIADILAKTSENTPSKDFVTSDQFGQLNGSCGFLVRKFQINYNTDLYSASSYSRCDNYRTLLRLSEAYLLYAEACAVAGDSDGSGLKALNDIASRAGYANGKGTYSSLTLDNVKNEKRYEMYGEFCRRNDLIRWGDAEKVLQNVGATKSIFFGYKAGKSRADIKADGSNIFDVYETRTFDVNANSAMKAQSFVKGKNEVVPFPHSDIVNNINLTQNPGFELATE